MAQGGNVMISDTSHFIYRGNEKTQTIFERSERFFCHNGNWFFKTREEIDYGPFQTRIECRYAYNEFIDIVSDSGGFLSDTFDYQDITSNWQPPKINFS